MCALRGDVVCDLARHPADHFIADTRASTPRARDAADFASFESPTDTVLRVTIEPKMTS